MTSDTVRARLIALSIVSATVADGADWVCLVGGLSDRVNAPQVAIKDTAGYQPLDSHDGPGVRRAGIQVLVRGTAGGYAAAATKAKAVWDALHTTRVAPILCLRGMNGPTFLGYTSDESRPQWSMNFVAFTTD